MCKRYLLSLIIFAFPLALFGEDEVKKEILLPASDSYRHVQSTPYIKNPEGITGLYKKFTISPQALPDPFFRYRLNILASEKETGNAFPLCVTAVKQFREVENKALTPIYQSSEYQKLDLEKTDDWQIMSDLKFKAFPLPLYWGSPSPRQEITAEDETKLFDSLDGVFQLLEKASKKSYYDWSDVYEDHGTYTILDSFSEMRMLVRYLVGKANWEIRNGNFEEAVKTLRVGYALSNHVLEAQPKGFLMGMLIGIACHGGMHEQVYYLSAQPGAPNLYPALMQMHVPQHVYWDSIQMETKALLPNYHDGNFWASLDTLPPERAKAQFDEWMVFCKSYLGIEDAELGVVDEKGVGRYFPALTGITTYIPAQRRLLQKGFTEEEIEKRTIYQILVPYIYERIRKTYDYLLLEASMPMHEQHTAINYDDFLESAQFYPESFPTDTLCAMVTPAIDAARSGWDRHQQTFDLLRIVSALRYYASVHAGKLPKSLDEITELAVPKIDPMTGKPFEYKVDGNTATIDYFMNHNIENKSRIEIVVDPDAPIE